MKLSELVLELKKLGYTVTPSDHVTIRNKKATSWIDSKEKWTVTFDLRMIPTKEFQQDLIDMHGFYPSDFVGIEAAQSFDDYGTYYRAIAIFARKHK